MCEDDVLAQERPFNSLGRRKYLAHRNAINASRNTERSDVHSHSRGRWAAFDIASPESKQAKIACDPLDSLDYSQTSRHFHSGLPATHQNPVSAEELAISSQDAKDLESGANAVLINILELSPAFNQVRFQDITSLRVSYHAGCQKWYGTYRGISILYSQTSSFLCFNS